MKKTVIILLLISLTLGIFSGCSEVKLSQKTDIFSGGNDELSPEITSAISYYKEFKGGTGFVTDSEQHSHYEYNGGEMKVNFTLENGAYGFECGFFVVLNGVFQEFTLTDSSGKTTEKGYMHTLKIPEQETVDMVLAFTPNIGKSGDILNFAVGTMQEPSYTCVYSGWPHYSKYGYHRYAALSSMELEMNSDSVNTLDSAADIKVDYREISDYYYSYVTDGAEADEKRDTWNGTQEFALYYDSFDFDKDVIVVPDGQSVILNMDILGRKADYRVSLFINNKLVRFRNGSTYFDITNTEDKTAHTEIPLDISDVPKDSHIYAIVSEKVTENTQDFSAGTYIYTDKTATYFFIKGELPDTEVSETVSDDTSNPTSETVSQRGTSSNIENPVQPVIGNIGALENVCLSYAAALDDTTLCFVGSINDSAPKAFFYDMTVGNVINTVDLGENARYYSVVNGNLIYADNNTIRDGKCTVIDKTGKVLNSFVYVDPEAVGGSGQIGIGIFKAIPRVTFNSLTGDMIYIAGGTDNAATYCCSLSDGQKTKIDFLSGENLPVKTDGFSGDNILMLSVDDTKSQLTLINLSGKKIKEMTLQGAKSLTCVGQYAVIFEQKNASGVSTDNKAFLLDCLTGKIAALTFKSNSENQWCTLSSDGKYVLTKEISKDVFRLYKAENSSLVKEFTVEECESGISSKKVLIDSKNNVIYVQTAKATRGGNEKFGVMSVKF